MNNGTTLVNTQPMTIRKITLWRGEIDGSPAALAQALQPLADAGIRLQAFMRYRHFRDEKRGVIEVCPSTEEEENRCRTVMQDAGLKVSKVPALMIESDPAPGLEYRFAQIIAEQNLHLMFCVTQLFTDKWVALIGFESAMDAEKAASSLLLMKGGLSLIHKDPETRLGAVTDQASGC
jgi:hypothetical protein